MNNTHFSHYIFQTNTTEAAFSEGLVKDMEKLIELNKDLIDLSPDAECPLTITDTLICFTPAIKYSEDEDPNDKDSKPAESFSFTPSTPFAFIKTKFLPYDILVCEALALFKHHNGANADLSSDGFDCSPDAFFSRQMYGTWDNALAFVKEHFGYDIKVLPATMFEEDEDRFYFRLCLDRDCDATYSGPLFSKAFSYYIKPLSSELDKYIEEHEFGGLYAKEEIDNALAVVAAIKEKVLNTAIPTIQNFFLPSSENDVESIYINEALLIGESLVEKALNFEKELSQVKA